MPSSKSKLKLYAMPESAPARIVQITMSILNLEHELVNLDLWKGEARTPEYLELNPQHNVPLLIDGDLRLNESRAIAAYLVRKCGQTTRLYSEDDLQVRARVDQRLYFDMGTFFPAIQEDFLAVVFQGSKGLSKDQEEKYDEILKWVTSMVKSGYVAGTPHLTLADVSFVASFSTLKSLGSIDTRKYPFIEAWFQRCKLQIPNYDKVCGDGAELMGMRYKKAKLASSRGRSSGLRI